MRRTRKSHDTADLLRSLTVIGPGELSEADKVQLVRSLRGQGEEVDTEIDRSGNLVRARLLRGGPCRVEAVKQTLHAWRCHPATIDGDRVAVHMALTLTVAVAE